MPKLAAFRSDAARAAYNDLYDAAVATSSMRVAESDVETSFGRTHVLTAGGSSKCPLVAIHPTMFSSTAWVPLLPTFAANRSVTMIDAPGDLNKSIAKRTLTNAGDVVAWLDETL